MITTCSVHSCTKTDVLHLQGITQCYHLHVFHKGFVVVGGGRGENFVMEGGKGGGGELGHVFH